MQLLVSLQLLTKRALGVSLLSPRLQQATPSLRTELFPLLAALGLLGFAADTDTQPFTSFDTLTTTSPARSRASLLLSVGVRALAASEPVDISALSVAFGFYARRGLSGGFGTWCRPSLEASSFVVTQPP